MHRFFALVVLLAGLLVIQTTVASAAVYDSCCVDDCKGVAQCVGMGCPACAAPAAATAPSDTIAVVPLATRVPTSDELLPAPPIAEIWNPPD